jgi:hypothetical protein
MMRNNMREILIAIEKDEIVTYFHDSNIGWISTAVFVRICVGGDGCAGFSDQCEDEDIKYQHHHQKKVGMKERRGKQRREKERESRGRI